MGQLNGRVALVTGASRGIGRAVALELARRGVDVAMVARSTGDLQATAAQIEAQGRRALALAVDLDDAQAGEALVRQTREQLGPISILVNNAAVVGPFGATWEVAAEEWERALRINLVVPFRLARLVLPEMLRAGWGRIINVSSGAARNPMERAGAYSVSKAGLDMLTRQLGIELAESGVAAVSVYPGVVDTAMQTAIRSQPPAVIGPAMAQRFHGYYQSGLLQPPERPARLIAALAGDAGARFNGQIVDIRSPEGEALLAEG